MYVCMCSFAPRFFARLFDLRLAKERKRLLRRPLKEQERDFLSKKKKQQLQQQSLAFQILRRISLAFSKYFVFIALRTRALNLAVIYISLSELRFLSSTSSDNIYPRCPLQRNCRTL